MKRIFLILLVCCIASLKAVGQNEVFIYEMTSYYKIQEEKEYQVGSGFMGLRLLFLPGKKLKVAESINGKYNKRDDGSIIEDSYKFYKVEDEDVYYENEFWTVDKSISIVIRLSSDRNRLEKYYINKDKEELNSIERYVLKSKEDEKSEKLPSWLK